MQPIPAFLADLLADQAQGHVSPLSACFRLSAPTRKEHLACREAPPLIAHFYIVKGRAYSFRFKDWTDYQATDQAMAEVTPTVWQLVKRYNIGGYEHVRTITKPVLGTVAIKVGGSPVVPSEIDYLTGLVTFGSTPGSAPTASMEFDVPVRFDTDKLPVQANAWDQQIVSQINLIEVKE